MPTVPPDRLYTPLTSPYPMSWPCRGCNWCGADETAWMYPIGDVTFPRFNPETEVVEEMFHHAQQWFACAGCKSYIDSDRLDELAEIVGRPQGYWDRLVRARLESPGFPWRRSAVSR